MGVRRIGVECDYNASLSEYIEIDPLTGKTFHDLAGLDFTPSPSGEHIAHIGPVIHFAPPYRKSNYLLIDGVTIYPLPKGVRPRAEKVTEPTIDVVRETGSGFVGIHNFASSFYWSADSKRVALIDCISDWIEKGIDSGGGSIGEAVNNRCSIAVVALDGALTLFPLPPDVPVDKDNAAEGARLSWRGDSVILTWPATRSFRIP